jgi:predicted Zn finger-like uncharacterized protein
MVVACPECGTRFSLEESRISGATAKVRCSRCRHVFRITREGQLVGPDWEPPGEEPQETPPEQEVPEEPPGATEPAEPVSAPDPVEAPEERPAAPTEVTQGETPPPPDLEVAPEETPVTPAAATQVETPVTPDKSRLWLWLPIIFLVVGILGGLGWWAWQGKPPAPLKPLAEMLQGLKGKGRHHGQPAPKADASSPAPTVVTPPPPPVPSPDLRELPVDWAQAHYQGLVNAKGGQLLVIQGEVINKGKTPRGPIRLKVTLTDAQHRPLRAELVYTGTTITNAELKTLDPSEIKDWLSRPGGRSQKKVLQPGEKQPFTAVFFGVPDNLAEAQSGFQLVVVEGPQVAGKAASN